METITSKFRDLYITKVICGYLAAIFCIVICLKLYDENDPTKEKSAIFFMGVIILFVLDGTFDFLRVTKIIVRNNAIEIQYFLGLRRKIIKYHEIIKINQRKSYLQGRTGQISDGFHFSEIILANKSSFTLSPDKFGNYTLLLSAINRNLNNVQYNE
ncbi:hypothetical protein [Myroides odoratus]|uniref:DUF304 domain-containing protein n=1 Tax=Myroides odoratus TaxID=256 RepID=A0A378RI39_MYROD|nr:hypothetical protein [Myroides odoratus]QQU02367.1 hypothetical protein I6I89_10925 [Myroides odoratus]STZ26693.1 Uncharacterised protein [Myroides odoratus]